MRLRELISIAETMNKMHEYRSTPFQRPIDDLLFDQRKGKFLTFNEKERIKQYAEEQRKKKIKN